MKKRKILYVGNALARHGKTPTTADTLPHKLRQEGYHVRVASSIKPPAVRLLHMLCLSFLYAWRVDAVLIDAYSTNNFWYLRLVSKVCSLLKAPYFPILHGGNLPERLKTDPKTCKRIFGKARYNVAPSAYLKVAFERHGYTNLIHIPNSIALTHYPFKERATLGPKLLWVRAFAAIYNPMMALKAFKIVQKTYPEATLCMVGPDRDGSLEGCSAFAKANDLSVHFTGKLSKDEWVLLSREYDIFINTTNFDNTPVSLIEAMALGLPILSTEVGGIPYLLTEEEGVLLPPDNSQGLAQAVINVIQNPEEARKKALKARKKAQSFDWFIVKEQWRELLG